MTGFKFVVALAAAMAFTSVYYGSEGVATTSSFQATFKGVDRDGRSLLWYGMIDWTKSELLLHGDCDSGAASGSSVTASATFTNLELAGTVEVLPVTASR